MIEPTIPPPHFYGLPLPKFGAWRAYQSTAVVRAVETSKRFAMIVAPTGFGKFCVGETIARYHQRSMYLTVTKILQDLIGEEIPDRFDIRGRANYDCRVLGDAGLTGWQAKCDQAESLCEGCSLKESGCEFYDAMRRLRKESRALTNYAKWLTTDPQLLGEFDCLVCDEAHGAAEQLSKALRIELDPQSVERFCGEGSMPDEQAIDDWARWSSKWFARLQPRMQVLASQVARGERRVMAELRHLRGLVRALDGMQAMGEEWLEDRATAQDKVAFEPVWPRRYKERLFRGIGLAVETGDDEQGRQARHGKIELMSATVTMKVAELLGIDPADVDYAEYPSNFPLASRPVIYVPTVAQRWDMSEGERLEAVRRVDQIIDGRLDRKGLIDTHSFARARHLVANSRHSARMLINDPKSRDPELSTAAVVAKFISAPPGTYLVTPSVYEGYDFKYEMCEFIVLMKVPLGQRKGNPLYAARCKDDGEYDVYRAMKKIVQTFGRAMRAADDRCEGLIVDDQWGRWFWRAAKRFAPQWFVAAVRGPELLPVPLPKLERRG